MTISNARYPPPEVSYYPGKQVEEGVYSVIESDSLPRQRAIFSLNDPPVSIIHNSARLEPAISCLTPYESSDTGSASLRFARPTTNHIPAWPSLQYSCGVPLGCIFQPFAHSDGPPIPSVHLGFHREPFRCGRCGVFVNAYFTWTDEGRTAACNFCRYKFEVPIDFFSPIDSFGQRIDRVSHPELCHGTVDYVGVSGLGDPEYSSAPTIFLIHVGFVHIEKLFELLLSVAVPPQAELGIVLILPSSIGVLKLSNPTPSLVLMSDLEDPFLPDMYMNFLVSPGLVPETWREGIEQVRDFVRRSDRMAPQKNLDAGMHVAMEILRKKNERGSIMIFPSSAMSLLDPIRWINVAEEEKIGIDLFGPPDVVSDDAIIALLHRTEGKWCDTSSPDELETSFQLRLYNPEIMTDCHIRIRASRGITIDSVDISRSSHEKNLLLLPRMTADTLIVSKFNISESLEHGSDQFIQLVCLYSRSDGQRVIRTHTVRLLASSTVGAVIKYADHEAIAVMLGRYVLGQLLNGFDRKFSSTRFISDSLAAMLYAYRTGCAMQSGSNQLVLPDSLRTLPLLMCGFEKNASSKYRLLRLWNLSGLHGFILGVCPRVFQVEYDPEIRLKQIPASRHRISPHRLHVIETTDGVVVYVGREVDARSFDGASGRTVCGLLDQSDPVVQLIQNLHHPSIRVIFQSNRPGEANVNSEVMLEDRINPSDATYAEYLCAIHKLIQDKNGY
jgi:protein transport protein SEC24